MKYELKTLNDTKGEEIYGALYLNGNRVGDIGFWRTNDKSIALTAAISMYEYNLKWDKTTKEILEAK